MNSVKVLVAAGKACASYGACAAPLCPLDNPASLAVAVWYPDEAICCRQKQHTHWKTMQKRIAKRTTDHKRGYFTVAMLEALQAVNRNICGVNPDRVDTAAGEAVWAGKKRRSPPGTKAPTEAQLRARANFAFKRRKASLSSGQNTSTGLCDPGLMAVVDLPVAAIESPQ